MSLYGPISMTALLLNYGADIEAKGKVSTLLLFFNFFFFLVVLFSFLFHYISLLFSLFLSLITLRFSFPVSHSISTSKFLSFLILSQIFFSFYILHLHFISFLFPFPFISCCHYTPLEVAAYLHLIIWF